MFVETKEEAFVPVTAMLAMDSTVPPVLVSVTCCDALVEPTAVLGKVKLLAESVGGGMYPVPVSAMLCGELTALSVIVTEAVSAPSAAGVKWPWMVQLPPAATLVPQVLAITNEDASAPVTAMLEMASGKALVLVKVTD